MSSNFGERFWLLVRKKLLRTVQSDMHCIVVRFLCAYNAFLLKQLVRNASSIEVILRCTYIRFGADGDVLR